MSKKLSDKDKKDWEKFIHNREKIPNKDLVLKKTKYHELTKKIDLHGYGLEEANKIIEKFINKCVEQKVKKILVITGKGIRSNNIYNPYISKDLSILKHSVPDFIKSSNILMKNIKEIKDAQVEDGGSGAFYIYLKRKL